ncbi:MAG: DUF2059 domain-containing protein [Pseudanabaenales cyanobacterium]|nr:DUF2059 domain-containing protein [Pseudanabaenales cyanobacterium]
MAMLKQTGWIGLILLSTIFLLGDNTQALTDSVAQIASPETTDSSATTPAQTPISITKRSLIYQLLEMTGGRQQYEQIHQIMFAQMQQQIQPMLEQTIRSRGDLSPAMMDAEIAKISANIRTFLNQFGEAIRTEITYDQMLEQVYYPVYDQYFTEEDLRSLIAFYQTPIGEKLITVTPQLLQASMQRTNEVFMPQMLEIMGQLMEQQIDIDPVNSPSKAGQ